MKKFLAAAFMVVLMLPVSAMAIMPPPTLQGTVKSVVMNAKTRESNGVLATHALVVKAGLTEVNNAKVWVAETLVQGYMTIYGEITMAGTPGVTGTASEVVITFGDPSVVMAVGSGSNTLIGQIPAHGTFNYNDVSGQQPIQFDAACDIKAVATIDPVTGNPTKGSVVLKFAPVNVLDADGNTFYLTIKIPTVRGLPPL